LRFDDVERPGAAGSIDEFCNQLNSALGELAVIQLLEFSKNSLQESSIGAYRALDQILMNILFSEHLGSK